MWKYGQMMLKIRTFFGAVSVLILLEPTSEVACPLELQQKALIFSIANNSPHLSVRWSQSLCVSSNINE